MFKRRKDGRPGGPDEQAGIDDDAGADELDGEETGGVDGGAGDDAKPRPRGPWDAADAPDDGVTRLDLGSLLLPGLPGVEVQVNVDQASGAVIAVTAVHEESALQLQAFAAPRGEAIWPDVRRELAAQVTADGGLADVEQATPGGDPDNALAGTLRAKLPVPQPDGTLAMGEVRFLGVDGPRWMLRGVLSGRAATEPAAAALLLEVFRGAVVVRGNEAYAPSEPLALRLPDQAGAEGAPDQPADTDHRGPLDLDGTGQRITQTR